MKKFSLSVSVSVLAMGCVETGDLVKRSALAQPEAETAVAEYAFAEHAPPPAYQFDIGSGPSPIIGGDVACAVNCLGDWDAAFSACIADDGVNCSAVAHDQVAACVDLGCYEDPSQATASQCSERCDQEAMVVDRECLDDGRDCLADVRSVYASCYDAECRDGQVARRLMPRLAVYRTRVKVHEQVAAETAPEAHSPVTCESACQAYDLSSYLACVDQNPGQAGVCRSTIGVAFDFCMATHCATE